MVTQENDFLNYYESQYLIGLLYNELGDYSPEEPFYKWINTTEESYYYHNFVFSKILLRHFQFVKKHTGLNLSLDYLGFAYQTKGFPYHADAVWPENEVDRNLGNPEIEKYKNYNGLWVPNYVPERKFTTVLYLNDDFNGGETHFPTLDILVKPESRKIVGFDCDEKHVHGVMPVTNGIRSAFICWFK